MTVALTFAITLTFFQGLTFLFLQSSACSDNPLYASGAQSDAMTEQYYKDECTWDKGMSWNVAATILWFLTGVSMVIIGAPVRPERPPPETQQVTYQKTTNPDGTTTVAEVGVVKGTSIPPPKEPVAQEVNEEAVAEVEGAKM